MTSSDSNLTLSWKRPWTIEEIIQSSQSWSLAADSGVCELLKSLSTDLLNEVAQVNNNINELSVESKQTNVIIQNAFNEFCMLANNQFMENLVEDVASCPITNENLKNNTECYPSKEEKLAQIIPQVTESLKMGLQVLENQFEIMDMQKVATTANQDESDNEMRSYAQVDYLTNEPIYHPKDPYENRHLPHLIGTKAFIEDDTLGIGYLDDLENQSESDSARSENASISGDLTSSISDNQESDDNEDKPPAIRKISSSESGGMFTDDGQSDRDLFAEDKPINSIKSPNTSTNTNTNAALARPLSLMDQLNNQLNKRFGLENTEKPNEQMENSFTDDDNQENQLSPLVNHRSEDLKKKLPFQASPNITRRVSGNSADEESDDLFGDYSTKNTKTEAKSVSSSITQMPPVVTSTPNNVDKKSDVKQKDKPKSKKSPNSLFDSDSDELFPREPAVPKPVVRSKKSTLNNAIKDSIGDRHGKENPSPKEAPTKIITPNKKQAPPVESDDDDFDDLFGPQVSKPAISTVAAVKPVSKQNNFGLFNSDDDGDLFNTPNGSKPHSTNPDKSKESTNLPKVESDKKIDTKAPKNETPVPKPFSIWLDSSSDDDLLKELPKSKHPVVSKPLKELNHVSIKQENSEIKVQETIKSEDIKEIIQTNNSNSSANNLEEFNEDKNIEDFDNLFITDKKENVSVETNKVLNDSKDSDPLILPKRKISFNISDNSDEDYSNKLPVIIPRSNLNNNNQKSSAGSGVLDASSPENLNPNILDIASDVKSSRESLPKLPPGAKPLFGPSLMNEMKSHQKSKLSFNSESEADIKDASHLFTPDKIDLLGSFERQTESNAQSNKQDFKKKLQMKLNEKSFINSVERVNKPEVAEENGIDLEIPPEEVHQLNLLTKSRVKINPRRRPTTKKAGNEGTIPTSDPVIPDIKTNSIPQPNVDSVPIVVSNQIDDTSNIFADLPSKPNKKSKSNKKSTTSSTNKTKKTVEVNVEEIDDIFTMATPKPKKAKTKSKIVSDPLGAL